MTMQVLVNSECEEVEGVLEYIWPMAVANERQGTVREYYPPTKDPTVALVVELTEHSQLHYAALVKLIPQAPADDCDGCMANGVPFDTMIRWDQCGIWGGGFSGWVSVSPPPSRISEGIHINDEEGWWEIEITVDGRAFVLATIQDVPVQW